MPEETSTSTTVCESVVSTQAASPDSRPVDTEAMSMSQPQPSSVSTISSAAAPALTGVAPIPAASTTCSGIMLSPPPMGACGRPVRDSSWLELDICRDFQKEGSCSRSDQCRFAHPEPNVVNRDGKVTCCYDFLKVSVPHSFYSNGDQDMQCGLKKSKLVLLCRLMIWGKSL